MKKTLSSMKIHELRAMKKDDIILTIINNKRETKRQEQEWRESTPWLKNEYIGQLKYENGKLRKKEQRLEFKISSLNEQIKGYIKIKEMLQKFFKIKQKNYSSIYLKHKFLIKRCEYCKKDIPYNKIYCSRSCNNKGIRVRNFIYNTLEKDNPNFYKREQSNYIKKKVNNGKPRNPK